MKDYSADEAKYCHPILGPHPKACKDAPTTPTPEPYKPPVPQSPNVPLQFCPPGHKLVNGVCRTPAPHLPRPEIMGMQAQKTDVATADNFYHAGSDILLGLALILAAV